jgi:hypothetical protein
MTDPTKPFHAHQGWYFRRAPDGGVSIYADDDDLEFVTDSNTWASIVAHVCARGENFDTYSAALAFHEQQPSPSGPEETP